MINKHLFGMEYSHGILARNTCMYMQNPDMSTTIYIKNYPHEKTFLNRFSPRYSIVKSNLNLIRDDCNT